LLFSVPLCLRGRCWANAPHAVPASKAESFIVIGFRLKLHPPFLSAFIRVYLR